MSNSYMIVSKETGLAVFEFFNPIMIKAVNRDKYIVETALDYLNRHNKELKENQKCNSPTT